MIAFLATYQSRKEEIDNFIELIEFLEISENKNDSGEKEFDKFFYNQENSINLTYTSLINILKSNVLLMIYNIIEYTISNLLTSIYQAIKTDCLSYIDVNQEIRSIWKKNILKSINDPNANKNTFFKKNDEIIEKIIQKSVLEFDVRNALPGGNLDGTSIKETFQVHGIPFEVTNYRPDILTKIKNNRNELAHGSVSFVDAMRDNSISDIKQSKETVIVFLEELIETVKKYIREKKYKF